MSGYGMEFWTTDHVLRAREAVRDELAKTPEHLYPLLHDMLLVRYRNLNDELAARHDDGVVSLDEIRLVGDSGSIEDAIWRLRAREQR